MELGAALHHSAQRPKTVVEVPRKVEAHTTHDALPGQGASTGGRGQASLGKPSIALLSPSSLFRRWRTRRKRRSDRRSWKRRQSCWRTRRRPSWRSSTLGRGLLPVMPLAGSTFGTRAPGGSAGLSDTLLASSSDHVKRPKRKRRRRSRRTCSGRRKMCGECGASGLLPCFVHRLVRQWTRVHTS